MLKFFLDEIQLVDGFEFVLNGLLYENKIYIQSAFAIPDKEKREQEETPLLKIGDSFKKIIITKDYIKKWRDDNGVITMSIFEFLQDINSLEN